MMLASTDSTGKVSTFHQGDVDSTGTETWQFLSCMSVTA